MVGADAPTMGYRIATPLGLLQTTSIHVQQTLAGYRIITPLGLLPKTGIRMNRLEVD